MRAVTFQGAHDRRRIREGSVDIKKVWSGVVQSQRARFQEVRFKVNAGMEGAVLRTHCPLDARSQALLDAAIRKFCLSARGYDRVLRVSRTIADLDASPRITAAHVAEALQYRIRTG